MNNKNCVHRQLQLAYRIKYEIPTLKFQVQNLVSKKDKKYN